MSYRLQSQDKGDSGGNTIGAFATKDMASGTRPAAVYQAVYPGSSAAPAETASYWLDWQGDIFDQWGFFYLYDPGSDSQANVVYTTINQADGTFATQTIEAFGRTFTLKHGWAVQGIQRMDVSVSDTSTFVFGMGGNMGSDSSTVNTNLTYAYTKNSHPYTLQQNQNTQNGSSTEKLQTYVVPQDPADATSIPQTKGIYGNDYLWIYTGEVKYGVNLQFSKTNDVKNWVVQDLEEVAIGSEVRVTVSGTGRVRVQANGAVTCT